MVRAATADGEWTARVEAPPAAAGSDPWYASARGALVAGLVPGQLLGWSWPDRLRHALALAAGGAGTWTREPGDAVERDRVDLAAYERLLDAVRVAGVARGRSNYLPRILQRVTRQITSECAMVGTRLVTGPPDSGSRPRSGSALTRPFTAHIGMTSMECSVFNWRILLGGAASAAILTAGVAAPAFAVPRASTPVPLNGITQGLSGSSAGGIFCALPNLPVSVGVTAAAGAIGESCSSTQVSGSSQSFVDRPAAGQRTPGRPVQGASQAHRPSSGQANGPARTASARPAPPAPRAPCPASTRSPASSPTSATPPAWFPTWAT